jgi:hypothetical protein
MNQTPFDAELLKKHCRTWLDQMYQIINSNEFQVKMEGKSSVLKLMKSKINTIEKQLQKNDYKKLSANLFEFNQKYVEHFK